MDKLQLAKEYYKPFIKDNIEEYSKYSTDYVMRGTFKKKKANSVITDAICAKLINIVDTNKYDMSTLIDEIGEIVHKSDSQSFKTQRGSKLEISTTKYINRLDIPNYKVEAFPINKDTWDNESNVAKILLAELGYKPDGYVVVNDTYVIILYCQMSLWSRSPDRLKSISKSQESLKAQGLSIVYIVAQPFNLETNSAYEIDALIEGYTHRNILYLNMIDTYILNFIKNNNIQPLENF